MLCSITHAQPRPDAAPQPPCHVNFAAPQPMRRVHCAQRKAQHSACPQAVVCHAFLCLPAWQQHRAQGLGCKPNSCEYAVNSWCSDTDVKAAIELGWVVHWQPKPPQRAAIISAWVRGHVKDITSMHLQGVLGPDIHCTPLPYPPLPPVPPLCVSPDPFT